MRLGEVLRKRLAESGWRIVNRTPLPVGCFRDDAVPRGDALDYLTSIAAAVETSGRAWVSITKVGGALPALRACITNFHDDESANEGLVDTLAEARASVS